MSAQCVSAGILVADHLCEPIPRFPGAGELVLCDSLPLAIGGCAANTALVLARLGIDVGVIGCVGHDAFGTFIVQTLTEGGVETDRIRRVADSETSGTLIINVEEEDRRFIHSIGANATLVAEDLDREIILASKVFYVGGYLLLSALDPHALAKTFREARRAGVSTVLDLVLPGPGEHWKRLEPVLAETDFFLPNEDEARELTGLDDPLAQADRFRQAGARAVIITCGENGTVLVSEDLRVRAGTYPVEYVGGTGAGDAFDAGFIAGLLAGEDLRGCLAWGSALGASCVRAVGATESVFSREEAKAFMNGHDLPIEVL